MRSRRALEKTINFGVEKIVVFHSRSLKIILSDTLVAESKRINDLFIKSIKIYKICKNK
jgi:hypothetical protein